MSTIVHKVPIPPPPPKATTRPTLSADEQAKYDIVLKRFSDPAFVIHGIPEADAKLTEQERFWLTRECLLRYLRATKWNESAAIKRLEATLAWRREYGFYDTVTTEYVEPEGLTGKEITWGYDVDGRPALYMYPSRQNTDGSTPEGQKKQLQYSLFVMEQAFDLMEPGIENISLMIDFSDRGKSPSLGTARLMLSFLQNHYPERLGRALIINLPYLVTLFFKAIMPFVDPVTREKIRFNPKVVDEGLFEATQVTTSWGGQIEIPYEHEIFWPALNKLAGERRERQFQTWKSLGGTVGLSEWDIRQEPIDEKSGAIDAEEKATEGVTETPAQPVEVVA
ncbi:hypothetical protein FRB99_006060 [Tulasnella sp. 403]|nr:hypothetical protein FRB99_006060 [Tulasnella sp. 403]